VVSQLHFQQLEGMWLALTLGGWLSVLEAGVTLWGLLSGFVGRMVVDLCLNWRRDVVACVVDLCGNGVRKEDGDNK